MNIYSSRHYDTDEALYADFTEATGIEVNRIEGTPEELIARMQAEGANSPADIFLTVDAGRIWLADREGLLQPVAFGGAGGAHPRAPAPPRRPLVRLLAARADDLLRQGPGRTRRRPTRRSPIRPAKGKICIRSVLEHLQPLADGLDHRPRGRGRRRRPGPRACSPTSPARPRAATPTSSRRLVSGACDIAVANTYYFARALRRARSRASARASTASAGSFPNQETTGTHVNIAAAGVAAHAPNRDAAISFLEYLATPGGAGVSSPTRTTSSRRSPTSTVGEIAGLATATSSATP